jgi:hypothetical protein
MKHVTTNRYLTRIALLAVAAISLAATVGNSNRG